MPVGIGEYEVGGDRRQSQRVIWTLSQAREARIGCHPPVPRDRPGEKYPDAELTGQGGR